MRQAPRKRSGPVGRLPLEDTIAHPFVFCNREVRHNLDGGSCCGLCSSFGGWTGLACAVVPPAPPSNVFGYRGIPPVPPAGAAPPATLAWRDEECAVVPPSPPSDAFGNRGTHHTPAEATPPCALRGDGGGQGPFLAFPRAPGQEQRRPRGDWGQGDGTVAMRYLARLQRGHSQPSAVIGPTAVRPRCDGLFPAGATLRRFSEQGDTLYARRGLQPPAPCFGEGWDTVAQLGASGRLPRPLRECGGEEQGAC